jgi:hypothetical protein
MDFNRPITYQTAGGNTIDFNSIGASDVTTPAPRGGYKVLSARFNEAPLVGYIDKRALRDGADVADTYLGTRTLSIVCGVFGTSSGDLGDKIQGFLDAMRPIPRSYEADYGFRQLAFSQATIDTANYSTGFVPMMMLVRPATLPTVTLTSSQSIGVSAKGFAATVGFTLLAKTPYRFSATERSIAITASSATTSFPNLGSAIAFPTFELIYSSAVSYAAATVASVTFTMDAQVLKLNSLDFIDKTTTNEVRWYVNFENQTVLRGLRSTAGGSYVTTLRQDVIDTAVYNFGSIPPVDDAATTLTTTYSGSTLGLINVSYREAWY